jgi:hypothetical protein
LRRTQSQGTRRIDTLITFRHGRNRPGLDGRGRLRHCR